MNLNQTLFEVIDMRSFSNLWFWLALAALWSMAGNYVLGVPYDMVRRAGTRDGEAVEDLELMVRIRVGRTRAVWRGSGLLLVALGALVCTTLALLGFAYRVEFAQALFLMGFPLSLMALLNQRTAERIAAGNLRGAALRRCLARHRRRVQVLGLVAVFVTAVWGMYRNLAVGPFGG